MNTTTPSDPRYIAPTQGYFTTCQELAPERLAAVEGVKPKGRVEVRRAMVGNEILMLHVFREKGLIDPVHKHDDHETVAYLISGKLRLVIGGEEFIAGPGTSWIHPRGVEHYSEALEDCVQLEIKSPPRKTWVTEA
ncbi:MAG TPA: cupin domain-containing protein [Ramlibacter sp.]|nr:cupin domain-containing protein [Ramlibacter sp.]